MYWKVKSIPHFCAKLPEAHVHLKVESVWFVPAVPERTIETFVESHSQDVWQKATFWVGTALREQQNSWNQSCDANALKLQYQACFDNVRGGEISDIYTQMHVFKSEKLYIALC